MNTKILIKKASISTSIALSLKNRFLTKSAEEPNYSGSDLDPNPSILKNLRNTALHNDFFFEDGNYLNAGLYGAGAGGIIGALVNAARGKNILTGALIGAGTGGALGAGGKYLSDNYLKPELLKGWQADVKNDSKIVHPAWGEPEFKENGRDYWYPNKPQPPVKTPLSSNIPIANSTPQQQPTVSETKITNTPPKSSIVQLPIGSAELDNPILPDVTTQDELEMILDGVENNIKQPMSLKERFEENQRNLINKAKRKLYMVNKWAPFNKTQKLKAIYGPTATTDKHVATRASTNARLTREWAANEQTQELRKQQEELRQTQNKALENARNMGNSYPIIFTNANGEWHVENHPELEHPVELPKDSYRWYQIAPPDDDYNGIGIQGLDIPDIQYNSILDNNDSARLDIPEDYYTRQEFNELDTSAKHMAQFQKDYDNANSTEERIELMQNNQELADKYNKYKANYEKETGQNYVNPYLDTTPFTDINQIQPPKFTGNKRKPIFAPVTQEPIKQYMPVWSKSMQAQLDDLAFRVAQQTTTGGDGLLDNLEEQEYEYLKKEYQKVHKKQYKNPFLDQSVPEWL